MFNTEKRRRSTARSESLRAKSTPLNEGRNLGFVSRAWVQLAVAGCTAALLTVVVGFGSPLFPYREGQRVDRDLVLKVDLAIEDPDKTFNEQSKAAKNSPLVFVNDPKPNIELRDALLGLARVIAERPDFEKLEGNLIEEWKLTPEEFGNLRSILPDETALPSFEERLDQVFHDIIEFGILDPEVLLPEKENPFLEIYLAAELPGFGAENDPSDGGEKMYRSVERKELSLEACRILPDGKLITELKARFHDESDSDTLYRLLSPLIKPTLTYQEERTKANEENARRSIQPVVDKYEKQIHVIVAQGQRISEEQISLLRKEHEQWTERSTWQRANHHLGLAIIILCLLAAGGFYLYANEPAIIRSRLQVTVLCSFCLGTVILARLCGLEPAYRADFLPIAVTCLFLTVVYNRSLSLVIAFGLSLLMALTQSSPMPYFIVLFAGTAVGVLVLDNVRTRTKLIIVGLCAATAYGTLSIVVGLLGDQPWSLVFEDAGRRFGSGLIAGFLISGSLPFIESMFGIMTDISLIELADTSHPLLRDLVRQAPGTYNHSISVSIIGEAAAKRIGCNSLLVRVGALFHDIGKMLKPNYFVENFGEKDKSGHEGLEPAMSTLIIIGHVKDGVDLAQQRFLPRPIIDMIEQHHGTTLVDYFYNEATREQQVDPQPEESVEESSFRYPGPRPQTKEAAVLMLADCVESASRVLSEPTSARIEKLVHSLAHKRLGEGQFNESGLTLSEVEIIEDSLIKSLTSVYHGRIKYPVAV